MKIVFFGSDDFAATSLARLIVDGYDVAAVVTPPDRARDRMVVTLLPVKMLALEHLIPILQPEELSDEKFQQELKSFDADLFVVIAYGKFLPKEILAMPKHFCVNVHASLLPKYRGAAPVNQVIIDGEKRTGVTIIKMNERMDAGEIIAQKDFNIPEDMDAQTLREKLADLGAACLIDVIKAAENGSCRLIPQDEQAVTFAHKLTREIGEIKWERSAREIHDLIRGLVPWPGAYTLFQGKRLKILEAAVVCEEHSAADPGTIIKLIPQGMIVACGQGQLLLKQVHLESSKPMDARSFSIGHRLLAGDVFGTEK